MDCSTLVLRGHWRVRGLGLEEGGRVLLSRAHRLSARAPFFLESESRENSRFAIGDFTCRLFCGQHCCDIVSNCCNFVPFVANLLEWHHFNFTAERGCLRPLRGSAYLVFRFYKVR